MKVTALYAVALVCLTARLQLLDATRGYRKLTEYSSTAASAGGCSRHALLYGQIHHDLMPWATRGIAESNIAATRELMERPQGNYISILVENGQVFLTSLHNRENEGIVPMIAGYLLELYEVSRLYKLPDMEFVIHVGDMPPRKSLPKGDIAQEHVLLAYYKMWDTHGVSLQILIPMSGHFRCYDNAFDAMVKNISAYSYDAIPWEQRKQVAITRYTTFCAYKRGSFLNSANVSIQRPCAREELQHISNRSQGLLDARSILGGGYIPMAQHAQHRYVISTDGWGVSSKVEKLMIMGSTLLKQASPYIAYYYAALVPWVHYVPFYELSSDDILEAIEWLKANDDVAKRIARNAKSFALQHLTRPARLCYYKELFTRLGKLYRYKPSCKQRAMCVPLLDELKYLACFTRQACDVHAALEKINDAPIEGQCPGHNYETAKFFHGYKTYMGN